VGPEVGNPEGARVGATDGDTVGPGVGDAVGATDGLSVGRRDGAVVGVPLGLSLGIVEGDSDGTGEGESEGLAVGDGVGEAVGGNGVQRAVASHSASLQKGTVHSPFKQSSSPRVGRHRAPKGQPAQDPPQSMSDSSPLKVPSKQVCGVGEGVGKAEALATTKSAQKREKLGILGSGCRVLCFFPRWNNGDGVPCRRACINTAKLRTERRGSRLCPLFCDPFCD
jgi:hypothetical protein